jgi:c-di-GMP-binding flagellar brake protein YcgR
MPPTAASRRELPLRHLRLPEPMHTTDAEISNDQQFEIVEDAAKIHALLEHVQTSRALLSIRVPTATATYNSMIMEIDAQHRWISIDELHPAEGHTLFLAQRKLTVFGEYDGVDIRFDGQLMEAGVQAKINYYKIKFPAKLKYFQKRSAYRVRLLRSSAISVILKFGPGDYAKGDLYNISAGGLGIKFMRTIPTAPNPGQQIPECEIRFPDGDKFVCALEARHMINIKNNEQALLGARFIKLNTVQQRTVDRFIASLEREARRKAT